MPSAIYRPMALILYEVHRIHIYIGCAEFLNRLRAAQRSHATDSDKNPAAVDTCVKRALCSPGSRRRTHAQGHEPREANVGRVRGGLKAKAETHVNRRALANK